MKTYNLWLKLAEPDEQGRQQIVESIFEFGDIAPPGHPFKCVPTEARENETDVIGGADLFPLAKEGAGLRVFVRNGHLVKKPVCRLWAEPVEARGDGLEECVVRVDGLTERYGALRIMVADMAVDFDDYEGLAVSWLNAAVMTVRIVDPFVLQEGRCVLTFTEVEEL
jgi:hypothetical protein